jgi:hypothetical protein
VEDADVLVDAISPPDVLVPSVRIACGTLQPMPPIAPNPRTKRAHRTPQRLAMHLLYSDLQTRESYPQLLPAVRVRPQLRHQAR